MLGFFSIFFFFFPLSYCFFFFSMTFSYLLSSTPSPSVDFPFLFLQYWQTVAYRNLNKFCRIEEISSMTCWNKIEKRKMSNLYREEFNMEVFCRCQEKRKKCDGSWEDRNDGQTHWIKRKKDDKEMDWKIYRWSGIYILNKSSFHMSTLLHEFDNFHPWHTIRHVYSSVRPSD